jgi:hypothetical protein
LKYVNSFRDRHGQTRHYFRRPGQKAIPLPGLVGSAEFMAAYGAALATLPDRHVELGASRTLPGTIDALIVGYYQSAEWQNLAAETQKTRRRIIERFREKHGGKRVALLKEEHFRAMLAAINKLSARRHWLIAIKPLIKFSIPTMRRDDRPRALRPSRCRRREAITLGQMTRSHNIARTGRSGRNSGSS